MSRKICQNNLRWMSPNGSSYEDLTKTGLNDLEVVISMLVIKSLEQPNKLKIRKN